MASKLFMEGKQLTGAVANALKINCKDKDGNKSTVQSELNKLYEDNQNENLIAQDGTPFRFGKNDNGEYGYIIADSEGADTVIPFKRGFNIVEPLFKTNMATTFTLNNCIIGKEYIVIYAPWSGSGYSTAQNYLSISSYSGCEAPVTLYSGNDTHHSVYRFYKIKATATTVKIQWHTGGGGPIFVFGQ